MMKSGVLQRQVRVIDCHLCCPHTSALTCVCVRPDGVGQWKCLAPCPQAGGVWSSPALWFQYMYNYGAVFAQH